MISAVGFAGDTLWVIDNSLRRVTYFDSSGAVLRVSTYALSASTGFARGTPTSLLTHGRLLVVEQPNFIPNDLVQHYDALLMRVYVAQADGTLFLDLGTFRWGPPVTSAEGGIVAFQPFADGVLVLPSGDGESFAILDRAAAAVPDAAKFRIRRLTPDGEEVLDRSYDYSPAPLTQSAIDAAVTAFQTAVNDLPENVIGGLRSAIYKPSLLPPVRAAVATQDGSVWLRRTDAYSARPAEWQHIGSSGEPSYVIEIPADVEVRFGGIDGHGRPYLIGVVQTETGARQIARYTVLER